MARDRVALPELGLLTTYGVVAHANRRGERVNYATVVAWADTGKLPAVRLPGRCGARLFHPAIVDAVLDARRADRAARKGRA